MARDWNRGTLKFSDNGEKPPAPDGKRITRKTAKMLQLYNLKRIAKFNDACKARLRARDIRRLHRSLRHTVESVGESSNIEDLYRPPAEESDLEDSDSDLEDEEVERTHESPIVYNDSLNSPGPEDFTPANNDSELLLIEDTSCPIIVNSISAKSTISNPKKRKSCVPSTTKKQPRKSPTCTNCQKQLCPGGRKFQVCSYNCHHCNKSFRECCGARDPRDGLGPDGPRLPCVNCCTICGHPACNSKVLGYCPNQSYMQFMISQARGPQVSLANCPPGLMLTQNQMPFAPNPSANFVPRSQSNFFTHSAHSGLISVQNQVPPLPNPSANIIPSQSLVPQHSKHPKGAIVTIDDPSHHLSSRPTKYPIRTIEAESDAETTASTILGDSTEELATIPAYESSRWKDFEECNPQMHSKYGFSTIIKWTEELENSNWKQDLRDLNAMRGQDNFLAAIWIQKINDARAHWKSQGS
jgi:hypothetical protein